MAGLPAPRGPVSRILLGALAREPHALAPVDVPTPARPLDDEDLHLALYVCYELHYRGFDGVDARW